MSNVVDHRTGRSADSRYLAKAIELEETAMPYAARTTIWLVGGIFGATLLAAAFIQLDEYAKAEGEIVPIGSVIAIQHFDGGIAEEILVADGDFVKKGAPLVRLVPLDAEAELRRAETQRAALALQAERLKALSENRLPDFAKGNEGFAALEAAEIAAYEADKASRLNQIKILESQLEQQLAERRRLTSEQAARRRDESLLMEELKTREELFRNGLATRESVFNLRRDVETLRLALSRNIEETSRVEQGIAEAEARLQELTATQRADALSEVGEITAKIGELDALISRLSGRADRTLIAAPRDGIVEDLAIRGAGAVIAPGATLMTIVPTDDELIVEAQVRPQSVGRLVVGQTVDIRVSAFDFATYGSIKGELVGVSAITFPDEAGRLHYRARIRLKSDHVGGNPANNRVLPGMQVIANIKTGRKSILDYLLKPITRGFSSAFREP